METNETNSQLNKLALLSLDGGNNIVFMFNPTEILFQGSVETAESKGARSAETGMPKVSFSNINAYTATIKNVIFDTYEQRQDVVQLYIENLRKAVQFVPGKQRPPVYKMVWGQKMYMKRCFIEKLDYKLTKFLANGTPVRATIDTLTIKEAEEPRSKGSTDYFQLTDEQYSSSQTQIYERIVEKGLNKALNKAEDIFST